MTSSATATFSMNTDPKFSLMLENGQRHNWGVNEFVALDILRDTLKNHFVEVDIVCETIELKYQSVQQLTQDLKQLGASNHNAQAAQGLMGLGRLRKMVQAYESLRDDEGQLPVSYEVHYIKAKTRAAI